MARTGIDPNMPMMADSANMTGQPIGGTTQVGWSNARRRRKPGDPLPPGTGSKRSDSDESLQAQYDPFIELAKIRRKIGARGPLIESSSVSSR